MFGWKSKSSHEEPLTESEPESEKDAPTWADGSVGPENPVSRIYGRLRGEEIYEARLATAK